MRALQSTIIFTSLDIKSNQLDDNTSSIIAHGLETNTSLKNINLTDNQITDIGAQSFADMLSINKILSYLNLTSNAIGDNRIISIFRALEHNETLKSLYLNRTNLTDKGAQEMAMALELNRSLKVLHLNENNLGDEGTMTISCSLIQNKQLNSLHLTMNNITYVGAEKIAIRLEQTSSSLVELNISQNPLRDAGIISIAQVLIRNTTLIELCLDSIEITINGLRELIKMIPTNKTLKVIKIYNTIISSQKYYRKFFLLIIISTIIFTTLLGRRLSKSTVETTPNINRGVVDEVVQPEVLLIYVYSKTHAQANGNLNYFIKNVVKENDGVDYYFILQNIDNKRVDESELPLLPRQNGHYVQHENKCFDLGSIGWFLSTYTVGNPWINQSSMIDPRRLINITHYKHFIFMNSSVRGPFYPPYFLKFLSDYKEEFEKSFYWYYVFTQRVNHKVKLVGSTISCDPAPHVQPDVFATDFAGLLILLKPDSNNASDAVGIFSCSEFMKDDPSHEKAVLSSTRILKAGYMIDCLLTKYQQIDFTLPHNQRCNQGQNPYIDNNFDGTPLEPYDVVFVKYTDVEYLQITKKRGELYERWMEDTKAPIRSGW